MIDSAAALEEMRKIGCLSRHLRNSKNGKECSRISMEIREHKEALARIKNSGKEISSITFSSNGILERRIKKSLEAQNIFSISDLISHTDEEVRSFKGIGPLSFSAMKKKIEEFGLSFL